MSAQVHGSGCNNHIVVGYDNRRVPIYGICTCRLIAQLEEITTERDKLHVFKNFVHNWLDKAGVPHDPDAEHNAKSGCRISGRLEWLKARLTAERDAAIKRAEAAECDNLGIIEATETLEAWTDYDTQTAPEVLRAVQVLLDKPHPGESIRAELAALRRAADAVLAAEKYGLFDMEKHNCEMYRWCQKWGVFSPYGGDELGSGTFCEAICSAIEKLEADKAAT